MNYFVKNGLIVRCDFSKLKIFNAQLHTVVFTSSIRYCCSYRFDLIIFQKNNGEGNKSVLVSESESEALQAAGINLTSNQKGRSSVKKL
jgi:hypothetical protein